MAKINYSFQKRQRDLAKKNKQQEKAQKKESGVTEEAVSPFDSMPIPPQDDPWAEPKTDKDPPKKS